MYFETGLHETRLDWILRRNSNRMDGYFTLLFISFLLSLFAPSFFRPHENEYCIYNHNTKCIHMYFIISVFVVFYAILFLFNFFSIFVQMTICCHLWTKHNEKDWNGQEKSYVHSRTNNKYNRQFDRVRRKIENKAKNNWCVLFAHDHLWYGFASEPKII